MLESTSTYKKLRFTNQSFFWPRRRSRAFPPPSPRLSPLTTSDRRGTSAIVAAEAATAAASLAFSRRSRVGSDSRHTPTTRYVLLLVDCTQALHRVEFEELNLCKLFAEETRACTPPPPAKAAQPSPKGTAAGEATVQEAGPRKISEQLALHERRVHPRLPDVHALGGHHSREGDDFQV